MKWPWQKRRKPMQTTIPAPPGDSGDDLRRAHAAATAAQEALSRAHARRPAVNATGLALAQTNSRNHLAQLVHDALRSGS